MTLGQKLQTLRKQAGMSQETLANQLEISRQAVSKWELDTTLPETENIIKLAKLFDVSFDYLLDENITEIPTAESQHKNPTLNTITEGFTIFFRKYGYLCCYGISLISLYNLIGYSITFAGFSGVLGDMHFQYTGTISAIPSAMKGILVMYILLSLAGTVGGIVAGKYFKKKTEKYRITQTEN